MRIFEFLKKYQEPLSLGFCKPGRETPDRLYDALFFQNKMYPDKFANRVKLLHPQLVFGSSPLTEYFEQFYYDGLPNEGNLTCLLGQNADGVISADLNKLIHLYVPGRTGFGKTFGVFSFLFSLMWLNTPKWLKISLFATKDIGFFEKICNVYTTPNEIREGAKELVKRLKKRMSLLKKHKKATIECFNSSEACVKLVRYEVLVFDEFTNILASLDAAERDEFENDIAQLASQGRSLGMHLIVMSQRPDRDSVPRKIKTQLPASLVFRQADQPDATICGAPESVHLKRRQAVYFDGENPAKYVLTPFLDKEKQIPFFCERIRLTMAANGWEEGFK